jgi:hypothetical protein
MKIQEIIVMLERRISRTVSLRSSYESLGEFDHVERLTEEIEQTQSSLALLRTLVE